MLALHFKLLIIVPLLAAYGCATTPERTTRRTQYPKYSRAQQPVTTQPTTDKTTTTATTNDTTTQRVQVRDMDLLQFVTRHTSDANLPLTDRDHSIFQQVEDMPKPGSTAEAVIVVGTAKSLLITPTTPKQQYQEENLHGTDNNTPAMSPGGLPDAAVPSLQNLLTTRGVNLPLAINSNSLLKNLVTFDLLQRALNSGNNTPDFVANVRAAMATHAAQWARFSNAESQGVTPLPADNGEPAMTAPQTFSPADLRNGDNILLEAQRLASNKMFPQAIAKAQQIQADSPMHAMAQDRIRSFSNQAVQDLRQKAAVAFQSAQQPVSDPKTRAAYLQQARNFLEQAIKDFPTADQIGTVRENLAVITRDLEQIGEANDDD